MGKIKVLILLLLLVGIVALFVVMNNGTKIGIEGTKAVNFITGTKVVSTSDFVFQTVNDKQIEIDVEDKIFHIKGMENKTVFFKVFGWNCNYCKKEIPKLIHLKKQLGDAFEVVAIEAQQHSKEESLKYIKEYGINYHIISGETHRDFYAYLQEKYGWTGIIPLTIVISKKGDVLAFELGSKSYSLSELMKSALLRE